MGRKSNLNQEEEEMLTKQQPFVPGKPGSVNSSSNAVKGQPVKKFQAVAQETNKQVQKDLMLMATKQLFNQNQVFPEQTKQVPHKTID